MEGGDPWSWIYEWACVKRNKVLVEGAFEHEKRVVDLRLVKSHQRGLVVVRGRRRIWLC